MAKSKRSSKSYSSRSSGTKSRPAAKKKSAPAKRTASKPAAKAKTVRAGGRVVSRTTITKTTFNG